jgi:methylglutaconyl-CoA hydratase/polyketide biosynthesis enoyl-CoA hydratase PksH
MPSVTRCETGDGVWRVTLSAAANGNAVNRALIDELTRALTEACADDTCRAVVIAAEGTTFCRGLDLEAFFGYGELGDPRLPRRFAECLVQIRQARVPVIACVAGKVMGGGVGLVAACDMVLATPETSFMLPEVIVGLVPALIVPFLRLRVGMARLRYLTLSTRGIPAAEAHGFGLVDHVADAGLDQALEDHLGRIFRSSPAALAETKRYFNALSAIDHPQPLDQAVSRFTTWLEQPDIAEGAREFSQGLAPAWFARYRGRRW